MQTILRIGEAHLKHERARCNRSFAAFVFSGERISAIPPGLSGDSAQNTKWPSIGTATLLPQLREDRDASLANS